MSVLEQFQRTGQVDDDILRLAYRVMRAVARVGNYPHPDGDSWASEDAIWSAVSLFYGMDGHRKLVSLCVQATNDNHLAALLETTIRRWFQALGRQSERGRLIRSLQRDLTEGAFTQVADNFWALADGPHEPTTVAKGELVSAAWQVHIDVIRARPDAAQRSAWAPADQRHEVLAAIIWAAGGAVHISDIAQVVVERVGLLDPPTLIAIDDADDPYLAEPDELTGVEQGDEATAIFAQLTHRERLALALFDEPVRDAAELTGMARSTFQDTRGRVAEILRRHVGPDDATLIRLLNELAIAHARTSGVELASTSEAREAPET